jgi:serine/threonine-protein kinase
LPTPGTLLEGKYEILGKIHEGGMGSIYRVRHRLLDEIRVVKVLRPLVVEDAEIRRRFLEEAKTATRLQHPNICVHYDFALDEDGTAFLVMEYIEGLNLSELLKSRGRPGLPLTLEIAHQALLALGYLHYKGVIHRDVAPDNLMLARDEAGGPLIKLIDLGIAKAPDRPGEMTATGVFLGKLKYASPEQYGKLAAGERLDGRSDLYSLGVVLYELSTGERPFAGETPAQLMQTHLLEPPRPFFQSDPEGRVPEGLRAVILKALEKKRENRYGSADDFDRDIVLLRHQFARPEDLEGTMAILPSVSPAEPSPPDSVTPSAQDRLDRQFGARAHTTPQPTPSGVTAMPTVATAKPATGGRPVSAFERAVTVPGRPSASAPARPAPEPSDTRPFPKSPRTGRLSWIVLAAVLLAALLWRPWETRSSAERTRPGAMAGPTSAATVQPTPAPPPKPQSVAEPAPEAAATALPTAAEEDSRALRLKAENARAAAARARQAATRAHAPELAAALYEVAARREREGERLFEDGDFHRSRAAFADAAADFEGASSWIASHPRPPQRPTESVATLPEPTAAPQPTARLEPTQVAAALASSSEDARQTAAPTEPPAGPGAEQERIRQLLRDYERAQNTLDLDLYARIVPSLTGAQRRNLEVAWQGLKSQRVEVEVRKIELTNSHAVVRGYQRLVATPRIGSELQDARERTFYLEKRGESWVITRLD